MIAIDTNVLLWAVRDQREASSRPMINRCLDLLADLQDRGEVILIPLPVLTEALAGIEEHGHTDFVNGLREMGFLFGELTEKAAIIVGRLEAVRLFEIRRQGFEEPKQAVKFDALIAGIAIAEGATHL